MTCKGTVRNGVVVLDPGVSLPEGIEVRVEPAADTDEFESLREGLRKLAGTVEGLPRDLARNHDHYLYGTPKT